ncbi:TniQ protein [Streptomyces sp. 846.5]|nr:TniQ family protein [Streptomyces sp. 846.5]TDT97270.1 TniQ protein [Streptomyces sp. 846.5]
MTDWTRERIPIWLPPVPGEALDSWLEAYARRLRITSHALTGFVGLPGSRPGTMTHRLTDQERDTLQRATGLSQTTLVSMTLEPFNGLTVAFDKNRPGSLRRPPHWRTFGAHPRFCPRCLHEADGRWPLAWRQPWTFACPRHQCMLLERCPACHQPARASGTRFGGLTVPAACTRGKHHHHGKHRDRIACGYALDQASAAPLPPGSMILSAQHRVDRVLDQISTNPAAVGQNLTDLYTLGSRALRTFELDPAGVPEPVRQILAEAGGAPPAQTSSFDAIDVRSIAIGTAIALNALPDPEPRDPELLDWIFATSHRRSIQAQGSAPKAAFYIAKVWSKSSPRLAGTALTRLDPSDMTLLTRLRYGTASPTPYWRQLSPDQVTRRASCVPAQLWPSWALLTRKSRSARQTEGAAVPC